MPMLIAIALIATTVHAQVSTTATSKTNDRVFSVREVKSANTLWLSADGTFKHVIPCSPAHLTIAYGTWRREDSMLFTRSMGTDWNKDKAGNWRRQVDFTKIWPCPLAGERKFSVVESPQTMILKDQCMLDKRKGRFGLDKLETAVPQSLPDEAELKRLFEAAMPQRKL